MSKELRIKGTELRTIEGENLNIEGYINAVGRESELLFAPKKGKWFKEIIEPGVFKRALQNNTDIPMLLEHDYSKEIARTSNGTLELTEDNIGLKFKANIEDQELYTAIKNGEINSCSFGFICEDEEIEFINNREEKRYIKDIQLLEVSLVKNPAYIGSLVEARNMEMALKELNINGKENIMKTSNKQENRAYCSYLWDTHDAINCCLELMACATSLLTYKDNSDAEIQALAKDILVKIGSYMVKLTDNAKEERTMQNLNESIDTQESEERVKCKKEKREELTDQEETEETNSSKDKKSEENSEENKEKSEENSEENKEKSEENSEENKEEELKNDSEQRNKINPQDEILLIKAKLSNLK